MKSGQMWAQAAERGSDPLCLSQSAEMQGHFCHPLCSLFALRGSSGCHSPGGSDPSPRPWMLPVSPLTEVGSPLGL